MVIATRADVDTRSIVRLPDADTSKKGYKFTDPDGEFPRVVPLPVQGDVQPLSLVQYQHPRTRGGDASNVQRWSAASLSRFRTISISSHSLTILEDFAF